MSQSATAIKNKNISDKPTEQTEVIDKTPPHGMKGPLVATNGMTPGPFLAGAVVLLAAALVTAGVLFFMRWRKERQRMKDQIGLIPIDPTAWTRLRDSIAKIAVPDEFPEGSVSNPILTKEWNQFSSEVSLCLRRGLEIRSGLPLAESTTEEILALLATKRLKLMVLSDIELRLTLQRLDAIRFGGERISNTNAAEILDALRHWCERLEKETTESQPAASIVNQKGELRVFDA